MPDLTFPDVPAVVADPGLEHAFATELSAEQALVPLWQDPAPIGHNGGPPLDEPRRVGRPTILTPELRDRIFDLLAEGVPLRAICRTSGFPNGSTVRRWRLRFPDYNRGHQLAVQMGYDHLARLVLEEVDRALERAGGKWARYVFNLRRQQLARMNPKVFGDRGMRC